MSKNQEIDKKQQELAPKPASQDIASEPFLKWNFKFNEETGQHEFASLQLSDKSEPTGKSLIDTVKRATGTSNVSQGELIIDKVSRGMSADKQEGRLNDVCTLLPALGPRDETEALLLGQFLALQDSGMKCLRLANLPEQRFQHEEKLFALAHKLLNTANQTMQTVLKYRSGGQQTVQVIHVHNEGQAIVAQNLSSCPPREGAQKKNRELNPLDHCGAVHGEK